MLIFFCTLTIVNTLALIQLYIKNGRNLRLIEGLNGSRSEGLQEVLDVLSAHSDALDSLKAANVVSSELHNTTTTLVLSNRRQLNIIREHLDV